MSLTNIAPKPPVYLLFQFDGTQECIDELNDALEGTPAAVEFVDSEHYKSTSDTSVWPLNTLSAHDAEVVLVASLPAQGTVTLTDYPNLAAAEALYDTVP